MMVDSMAGSGAPMWMQAAVDGRKDALVTPHSTMCLSFLSPASIQN